MLFRSPTTTSTSLDMSPLSGLAAMGAGTAALFSPTVVGSGSTATTTNLWNQISQALGIGNKTDTSSLSGILPNNALPGQPGYGWQYFANGTSIGPDGTYYQNGVAVTGPDASPLDSTGTTTDSSGSQTNTSDTGTQP